MGFFDFFSGSKGGPDKAISKHIKTLTNPYVQHEDRLRAAELLAQINTDESLFGLLKRYDITLDKSYQDMDEKVYVKDLLVSKGQAAVEPIRRYLKGSENVNWPERILTNILDDEKTVVDVILEVLESIKDSGDMKGAHRKSVISMLKKYQDTRIAPLMLPFLHDFDEGVRAEAVEVLDVQADPRVREELFQVMTGPDEESMRVRRRVVEIFVKHQWSVADWLDTVAGWLPEGVTVVEDKLVEA